MDSSLGAPAWSPEVWAGPSWSSFALKVRSLLLPGFQDPYKSVLFNRTVHRVHSAQLGVFHTNSWALDPGPMLRSIRPALTAMGQA
jgi:hypothetical protein